MQIKGKIGKTIWWSNIREKSNKDNNRWRHDTLFGITRSYSRRYRYYLYRFTFWKFTIGIGK